MPDLNSDALGIWEHLKPAIDKEIEQKTRGMVQRRKMKVTTAPSISTGTIGVTEAFGSEMVIPFATNLISANVGDMVWVEFMYGATNAFASMFASADEKDWDVAGDLSVGGNAGISGNLGVSGSTSLQNTTVKGILDVTQRRCAATLSSQGWYRVLTTIDNSGSVFGFTICRPYGSGSSGQAHKIDFFMVAGGKSAFANETSDANALDIDKIRCTYGGGYVHFDVHYNASISGDIYVDFTVDGRQAVKEACVSNGLTSVADSPSGETVLTEYAFSSDSQSGVIWADEVITTSAGGYYNLGSKYPMTEYRIMSAMTTYSDAYILLTGSSNATAQWIRVFKSDGTSLGSTQITVKLVMLRL